MTACYIHLATITEYDTWYVIHPGCHSNLSKRYKHRERLALYTSCLPKFNKQAATCDHAVIARMHTSVEDYSKTIFHLVYITRICIKASQSCSTRTVHLIDRSTHCIVSANIASDSKYEPEHHQFQITANTFTAAFWSIHTPTCQTVDRNIIENKTTNNYDIIYTTQCCKLQQKLTMPLHITTITNKITVL